MAFLCFTFTIGLRDEMKIRANAKQRRCCEPSTPRLSHFYDVLSMKVGKSQFLGIDLGTTSVKIALIDAENRLLYEWEKPHNAHQISASLPNRSEQCPKQIFATLHELLANAKEDGQLQRIDGIGISGQMHGVVLWNDESINRCSLEHFKSSNLITWMDGRCDSKFLSNLPKWTANNCEQQIATGYGMATLAWLKANGHLRAEWNRVGTIMDLLAAFLIQTKEQSQISTQNAHSWGYTDSGSWTAAVHDNPVLFPLHLLPSIVPSGTICGHTFGSSTTLLPFSDIIPSNVPVLIPLGDLQASLLPMLNEPSSAALHIGTSAQLAFVDSSNQAALQNSLARVPYFEDNSLLVAASLNGGNALDCFVQQITSWSRQLLLEHPSEERQHGAVDYSAFFERSEATSQDSQSSFSVQPIFLGERHYPTMGASVQGWRSDTTLETFLCSIARGIVRNLAQMMPPSVLAAHKICRLKLVGRAKQKIFADEAKRQFPDLEVQFWQGKESAAFGAAMHAQQILSHH